MDVPVIETLPGKELMCATNSSLQMDIILLLVCWLIVQLELFVHCLCPMQGWLARFLPSNTCCSLATV